MQKILIVDDNRVVLNLLRTILSSQGWGVETAQSPERVWELTAQQRFDLVICDINLEAEQNGIDLLKKLRDFCPVILITGAGTLENTVEAEREGARDIIAKPFDIDGIVAVVKRVLAEKDEKEALRDDELCGMPEADLLGRSPQMVALYKKIARVAPTSATVLVTGESGTGKELVARAVHKYSLRANANFIPVNCGALTDTLLESELFGHKRGSFTGAVSDRRGLWEEAGGGTLFLDEIGETSQLMQVKMLRALQEKEIRRVGDSRSTKVDTRIIAATNRDLEEEVGAGRFREDLFYRLNVVTLNIPPLRERRSDIPLLAERFVHRASVNCGRRLRFSDEALRLILSYDWHGNVRELESAVEHAALNALGTIIECDDLPEKMKSSANRARAAAVRAPLTDLYADFPSLDELEQRYLVYLLDALGGSRTRAAEILRINRRTLYRMAERFGISLETD
ncbi:MAG: sigma-54-dependent Fis family transcriptional regulator [Acidobacteria bacterium]|nr:sigma-54-dependent Fis family transcriptional regulator [Acidobacteriota bacterium]